MLSVDKICELESRRWEALRTNDTATLTALMDDRLAYTHSNGLVDTKTEFLARLDSGALRYLDLEPTHQLVEVHGDTAVVSGRVVLHTEAGGARATTPIRYTAVWARGEGGWAHVAWHSSPASA